LDKHGDFKPKNKNVVTSKKNMLPKKNLNKSGRILRGLIALLLFAYSYWQMSWLAFFFGLFTCFESYASWCVLYQILGKNACPVNNIQSNKPVEKKDNSLAK